MSRVGTCLDASMEILDSEGGVLMLAKGWEAAIEDDADPFWKEVPTKKWNHFVVVQGDIVRDPAGGQFGAKYDNCVWTLQDYATLWESLTTWEPVRPVCGVSKPPE